MTGAHGSIPREVRSRIEEAVEAIDAPAAGMPGGDYILAPLEHARWYEQSAPELADRLRMSDLRISAEVYVERDARANSLRAEFEKISGRARNAVLVTTIAAALLVASAGAAAIPAVSPRALDGAVIALSVLTVVSGALAAGWIHRIRGSGLLERWMKRRAEAESERLRYFSLIAADTRLKNPLLQLEYIRRYQLDVQRAFFETRGEEHRRGADRQVMFIGMATAAAGIATGIAGVLGASIHTSWTSLAALGLVAQAFTARAENRLATEQSARNAERYDETRAALDEFSRLLDEVRLATAVAGPEDDLSLLRQYVAAIHDRLAVEHRQWIDDKQLATEALANLEKLLQESRRKVQDR